MQDPCKGSYTRALALFYGASSLGLLPGALDKFDTFRGRIRGIARRFCAGFCLRRDSVGVGDVVPHTLLRPGSVYSLQYSYLIVEVD